MSEEYDRLDRRIQKWVYQEGWTDLRDIQKMAIPVILAGKSDVVISAATASGKTEAAFLPACSAIADEKNGIGILYISPLKALINDQYRRMERLCRELDMPLTPWHGDVAQALKKQTKQNPCGILLITPESLESLLVREHSWLRAACATLQYIIIDEFHAFVGGARGCQLQSVMSRLDHLLGRPVPRIALSATLGDMGGVMRHLRPSKSIPCSLIEGKESHATLNMQIRGYIDQPEIQKMGRPGNEASPHLSADQMIANDLYKTLRGKSNLVFANSRPKTEKFASLLSDFCERDGVPNEFFPHHGSLAPELRNGLEARLQKDRLPTTAICTMTLELGIDIGKVESVAQVGTPSSVASLRQRLGRSGRRGKESQATLRMYLSEKKLNKRSNLTDRLRLGLVQSLAVVRLMLRDKWYEPPDTHAYHFSTLLHQILAVIAQWGGVRDEQIWQLLCAGGPFSNISNPHFGELLAHMLETTLINQCHSGELVLGGRGEKIVNYYTFYAVFNTREEYRVVVDGKTWGTLPVVYMPIPGDRIIFGGRPLQIKAVDVSKRMVIATLSKGGQPPRFGGEGMPVHDRIRQEMLDIYRSGDTRIAIGENKLEVLDPVAQDLFREGVAHYKATNLESGCIVQDAGNVYIAPWLGDKVINTLAAMLKDMGYSVSKYAGMVEIANANQGRVRDRLAEVITEPAKTNTALATGVRKEQKQTEIYDYLLPESLLNVAYGANMYDSDKTWSWLSESIGPPNASSAGGSAARPEDGK